MYRRWFAALMVLAPLAVPAGATAKPPVCAPDAVRQTLIDLGKLTPEGIELGEDVDLIRCGDVTNDGITDALFTIASGGTAGDIRFGVLRGSADGSAPELVLYKQGYKVGIARHDKRSFDVLQPHYAADDANCCPSSFRQTRYTWTGERFKAGKAKKLRKAPARFYRP